MSIVGNEDSLKLMVEVSETYQIMPIDQILENTWNPNIVNDVNFERLKADINTVGSNKEQPIMVRTHPTEKGMYEIVDGAHRFKAMKELGFEEIIVVIKELSDKDARMKTISMNKFRGDFDNVQLAELIIDLKKTYSATDEEISGFLGYTPEEIKGYESLVNFDFDEYNEELPEDLSKDEIPNEMILSVTDSQRIIIEKAVATLGFDSAESVTIIAAYFSEKFAAGEISPTDIRKLRDITAKEGLSQEELNVPDILPESDIPLIDF